MKLYYFLILYINSKQAKQLTLQRHRLLETALNMDFSPVGEIYDRLSQRRTASIIRPLRPLPNHSWTAPQTETIPQRIFALKPTDNSFTSRVTASQSNQHKKYYSSSNSSKIITHTKRFLRAFRALIMNHWLRNFYAQSIEFKQLPKKNLKLQSNGRNWSIRREMTMLQRIFYQLGLRLLV